MTRKEQQQIGQEEVVHKRQVKIYVFKTLQDVQQLNTQKGTLHF